MKYYDRNIIIIGGGPGGYVAAIRAAQLGGHVTLIEAADVGGTCLNHGCIPSKVLIHDAEVMGLIRKAKDFGIEVIGDVQFNIPRLLEQKKKVIETHIRGIHSILKSWGIRYKKGWGSLINDRTVLVANSDGSEERLTTDRIILATGSKPFKPEIFPFDGEKIITSVEALSPETIPSRLIIIGAGVEGSEFAFMYRGLGSAVTVVELKQRVLHTEDEEISLLVQREMKKRGIQIHLGIAVEKISIRGQEISAILNNGQEMTADQLLVSIGRQSATEGLGLERTGITPGQRGEVKVNEQMETSSDGIYAIGDMVGHILLAHVASAEGKVAAHNSLVDASDTKKMDYRVVPAGIFTQPEVGTVGLKDWEASQQGVKVKVGRFPFQALGRAHTVGDTTGLVKIISDAVSHEILGVHIFGSHASDLIHEAALGMRLGAKVEDLAELIHAHPTFPEAVMEAAEDARNTAIHLLKKPIQ
jgi:dihydrolipoamide dehydrogenase